MKRFLLISALIVFHAACIVLMYPPVNAWPLAFISVAPLALGAIYANKTWHGLVLVFIFTTLAQGWMHRWTINVTQAGFYPLVMYQVFYTVLFAWMIRRVAFHHRLGRWPMALTLPAVWTGIEFFRCSVFFHGYPWFQLAHPIIEAPVLAQSADLLGAFFITFLLAMVNGAIVDFARLPQTKLPRRRIATVASIVIILHLLNVAYGLWRVNQSSPLSPGPVILAVQTNLPQDNRTAWSFEMQARDVPEFMDITRRGIAAADAENITIDVIAWPETLVPGAGFEPDVFAALQPFGDAGENYYRWPLAVAEFSREVGIPMLVGAAAWFDPQLKETIEDGQRYVWLEPGERYNSAYLIQGDSPFQRYDKMFLTPFGETMPYISSWPWLEQQFLAVGAKGMKFDLEAATEASVMKLKTDEGDVALGTPICFEDCMSRVLRKIVYEDGTKRAQALANLSNDGWYTWDDGSRQQRAQMSRWRCIENRVPLVRSVNTGLSVHIDSRGYIIDKVGEGKYGTGNIDGFVLAQTALDSRETLYGRIGDTWGWLCLVVVTAIIIITFLRKRVAHE